MTKFAATGAYHAAHDYTAPRSMWIEARVELQAEVDKIRGSKAFQYSPTRFELNQLSLLQNNIDDCTAHIQ